MKQSVLSRRIGNLEDMLGASLFERTREGVRLTCAGEQIEKCPLVDPPWALATGEKHPPLSSTGPTSDPLRDRAAWLSASPAAGASASAEAGGAPAAPTLHPLDRLRSAGARGHAADGWLVSTWCNPDWLRQPSGTHLAPAMHPPPRVSRRPPRYGLSRWRTNAGWRTPDGS